MSIYSGNSENSKNGAGFLYIIAIIFLSISVWRTAIGFEQMLGPEMAWIFSFALGLMMLFLSFQIRKNRMSGRSVWGPLVGYIACAIFCFFGNFNANYSYYNKKELFSKELQKHKQELTAIVAAATSALKNADPITVKLQKDVSEAKNQLILQIKQQANPGVGPKAREIIDELEKLLNQKLTPFDGTPTQLILMYQTNIDNILSTRMDNSRELEARALIENINARQDSLNVLIDNALKPQNISSKGQDIILKSVDAINSIGEQTKNFLGKSSSFEFQEAVFENQEIGKMSHSFSSAFNGQNNAAAIICLLTALAIDILVPFVMLVGTQKDGGNNTGSIESGKGGIVVVR